MTTAAPPNSTRLLAPPVSRVGPATALLLLASVVARESGLVSASVGAIAALVIVATAAAFTLRQPNVFWRLSELYLWLAFIVSVYHLHLVAAAIAGWFGMTTIDVFRALAVAHLLAVCAALWILQAWASDPSTPARADLVRLSAAFFVIGAVVFWVGARTFPGLSLDVVAANLPGHYWTTMNFLVATVITIIGLALLTQALRDTGDRVLAGVGLLIFSLGSVFWVVHLAYRLTVVVQAAEDWRVTTMAPDWYEPWRAWAALLFAIHSVLAYLGLAAYGRALLATQWTPRWIAWSCILAGLLAAPLGGLPLFIHVPLWLAGIAFLTRSPESFGRA
jgi:hypothetical protein